MPKLSQRGVVHLIVLLILLAGIAGIVYLVTAGPLKIFPKASVSGPVNPTTSFSFFSDVPGIAVGNNIAVKVLVRSDIANTNLFNAKITFPADKLAVDRIDYAGTFVNNWVEQYFDNTAGTISLVGGVPNPGFDTDIVSSAGQMAVIHFTALKAGTASISFTDESAIFNNADNANILVSKESVALTITAATVSLPICPSGINCYGSDNVSNLDGTACQDKPLRCVSSDPYNKGITYCCDQPSSTPTISPSPFPVSSPVPGIGDGNGDGKINLVDLSILLSDFNKTTGFRQGIDLNGDGIVNTPDFILMRNLLIQRGVIRG